MKYSAPDFERVAVEVNTIFASYPVTGCMMDEGEGEMYNALCEYHTYESAGLSFMCYSTYNK